MLIHPAEARCESANNIQATVRPDNRLESQGPIDQIAGPLGTEFDALSRNQGRQELSTLKL